MSIHYHRCTHASSQQWVPGLSFLAPGTQHQLSMPYHKFPDPGCPTSTSRCSHASTQKWATGYFFSSCTALAWLSGQMSWQVLRRSPFSTQQSVGGPGYAKLGSEEPRLEGLHVCTAITKKLCYNVLLLMSMLSPPNLNVSSLPSAL